MTVCLNCGQPACTTLVDFGPQPVCHHFFDGTEPEGRHELVLGQCDACGQVQLINPIPPQQLIPRFDWLVYNEPEAHVAELTDLLAGLPGITPAANVCGISHKDRSTLAQLSARGFQEVWRPDPTADLAMTSPQQGIETIQQRIQPTLVPDLHRKYGVPDLVVARHVLEHTQQTRTFLAALRRLVSPTGYVAFEIPDSRLPMSLLDYTTLWEDHALYFDDEALPACLSEGGFEVVRVVSYPAPYETVVVAIARPRPTGQSARKSEANRQREVARRFASALPERRAALRRLLTDWKRAGQVALFGAGHHAVIFVNLMGLADLIDFVVDDHPRKRGLRLPGSRLPIVGSEKLLEQNVRLCLSSLGAGSEQKVLQKQQAFIGRGGTFAAIFPSNATEPLTFLAGPQSPTPQP
jgi:hypothetical protein